MRSRTATPYLTWDVRGFGGSERRPDTMAPEVWASDLAAVLDEVGTDDAVIGGISMGGVVSQRFALDFPDRTRALILISTSSEVNERATAGWNARADLIERDGLAKALTPTGPALSYGKEYRERHTDDIADAAHLTIERNDAACYAAACRAVSDIDYTADLATISCPTLILQGPRRRPHATRRQRNHVPPHPRRPPRHARTLRPRHPH